MKIPWITDPKDKLESVSLTLLVLSLFLLIGLGIAQVLGKIQSVGPFTELFYSSVALYFGRRLNIGGKPYSADEAESIEEKIAPNPQT